MEYKKPILDLLSDLKALGVDRAEIEKGIDVGANYIDQVLARGGNKVAFNKIKRIRQKGYSVL